MDQESVAICRGDLHIEPEQPGDAGAGFFRFYDLLRPIGRCLPDQ